MNLDNSKIDFKEWKRRVETKSSLSLLETYYKKRKDTNRNETWLRLKCIKCGEVFERSGGAFTLKHQIKTCKRCDTLLRVSLLHARVCCAVDKVFNEVEFEYDIGFLGDKNGISEYDLYIKDINMLIEFQSRFHDSKEEFDTRKREFAINKGYNFMAIDHREFSFSEAMKLILRNSTYCFEEFNFDEIDISVFNKISFNMKEAQKMLNSFYTYRKIGEELGVHYSHIKRAVDLGELQKPSKYKQMVKNIKPFVQLTMDGEFVRKYDSSYEMEKSVEFFGKKVTIKESKVICQYGYAWVYEEEYINNTYTIPNITRGHCKSFAMVDNQNNILKKYTSIKEACEDIKLTHTTYLKKVLLREKEEVLGYKFIFIEELNKINKPCKSSDFA